MNLFGMRFTNSLEVYRLAVTARASRKLCNPEEVCLTARNPFTRHKIFAWVSARRGLHTIDNADDVWQIEAVDRPSEALRTHEEGSWGRMDWVKRVGVLNLGNYYFPHMFCPLRVRFTSSGNPSGAIVPARFGLVITATLPKRKEAFISRDGSGDSQLNVLFIGVMMGAGF
jgi:hypothetical protein